MLVHSLDSQLKDWGRRGSTGGGGGGLKKTPWAPPPIKKKKKKGKKKEKKKEKRTHAGEKPFQVQILWEDIQLIW